MFDDVIKLLKLYVEINEYGDRTEDPTKTESREVFAKVKSIGMKEKYQALAVGLEPELTFVLADYLDYKNEEAVEYNDIRYRVIRTYQKEGTTELELVVMNDADA